MERRVIDPVCQCSSTRPVESTIGYSSSGSSSGGMTLAGTILPRPLSVGKPVVKMISLPGWFGPSTGYVTAPSRSNRSQVIFLRDGMSCAISVKTSPGPE